MRKRRHDHPLYNRWKSMHDRCYRPKHVKYKFYGGKGITVCERWHDFWNFVEDVKNHMENGKLLYQKGYQLDKDRNGATVYSLENCRVITAEENRRMANESQSKSVIAIRGNERIKFSSLADAGKHLNLNKAMIGRYAKNGRQHYSGYRFEFC
ncbi:hypothetical protein [Bacillus sp. FJAT-29814]|uniref:hypothetical protein n=1 Tax=Bacillus sp. FJAT-29814 TaxID=1729688 RepID=UPI000A63DB97|nr:hypothetical protein [Bacillus sp. FJAT-29814]